MAERRMFAKTIIDSDAFIDMPVTARLLYYDLAMRADDDGFVNSPKKIMRMIGASQDDLGILILRKFIIPFDNGIVVIKHWRIHNYIRKDTYNPTPYSEQMDLLEYDENNAYRMKCDEPSTSRQRAVNEPSTQDRLGKDSIGKDSSVIILSDNNTHTRVEKKSQNFKPPTVEEVRAYCEERKNGIDPESFVDFYTSKGWMVGKNKMKDWKAAIREWERRRKSEQKQNNSKSPARSSIDLAEAEKLINKF